jgi:hypothetical protein
MEAVVDSVGKGHRRCLKAPGLWVEGGAGKPFGLGRPAPGVLRQVLVREAGTAGPASLTL